MAGQKQHSTPDDNSEGKPVGFAASLMLEAISQLLIATRSHQSPGERRYANEFAARILAETPPSEVVKAAELIAKTSNPPEELQRQLVFSSNDAAAIVLKSRYVSDAVLMEAASKSFELRQIVAARRPLSEPVVNRLLFFEENEIQNLLLARTDVTISTSRAHRLIDRVEKDSTLGWLLAKRTDLSTRHALRLFWLVGPDSRALILKRFNINPTFAAKIFTQMMGEGMIRKQFSPLGQLAKLVARAAAEDASEPNSFALEALRELRTNPSNPAAMKVADTASISTELAEKIMKDEGGEAFAILAASLGITGKPLRKLLSITPPHRSGLPTFTKEVKNELCDLSTDLDPARAIAILSYWEIDLQDRRRERLQERLEAELSEIQRRFEQAYSDAPARDDESEDELTEGTTASRHARGRLAG
ncbi:MAG: DUF2336 domain-containing protein [Parvularcula sp.]|jgi:hypothetical protein|nr:DUF2336 domain-containing protein [Parvularcula sp.]